MREVGVIALCLALSHWVCLADGQSKKNACSYGYEEAYRLGYLPEYIPLEICTHVVFKWFNFPRFAGRQMLFDDNDKAAFSRLVASVRKRSGTGRVVASITGTGTEYSTMSGTNVRRRAFVQAVSALLLELDADGVELAWDSPGNENSGTGIATDRLTMVTLLQDLRQAVTAASKLVSGRNRELWIRGSLHPNLISTSYNTFDVCELVDHVTLLSTLIGVTLSHAPINSGTLRLPNIGSFANAVIKLGNGLIDGTQTWIDNGCPPKKLLLGIGLHGVSSSADSYQRQFFGNRFFSWGSPKKNVMPYREVCQTLRQQGWSVGWDPEGLTPYATRSLTNGQSERISYEDLNSVRYKMDLVEQKRLGGVYTNYIHSDDIYGSCGQAYPLTAYISYRVRAIPSDIGFAIEWN